MGSPASDASWLLISKSVGAETPAANGWAIRIGGYTQTPDKQIALFDSGGFNPNTKWLLDFVTVQVLVRGAVDGYDAAYNKAQDVKDVLLGLEPQFMGVAPIPPAVDQRTWWSGVTMLADIAFVYKDDSNRPIFSINFRILQEKKPSALTNRRSLDDPN